MALVQLAHLHQAGQRLAEAQERAAPAETTAAFLRERQAALRQEVAELRQRLEGSKDHLAGYSGSDGGGGKRPLVARQCVLTEYLSLDITGERRTSA